MPVIVNIAVAKIFGRKVKEEIRGCKLNVIDFSQYLLKGTQIKTEESNKPQWATLPYKSGVFKLDKAVVASGPSGVPIEDLAKTLLNCGFTLLFLKRKKVVNAYFRSQRFIAIIPVLAIIAALFMRLAGKVNFNVAILIAVSGLAIASITGIFTLMTGFRALQLSTLALTRSRGFLNSEQRESLQKAAKSQLFRDAVPPILKFLV